MDENKFWSIVDSIGWPELARTDGRIAFGRIKVGLMKKYPAAEMDAFMTLKREKAMQLYQVIRAYNELHGERVVVCGGDSGDDLINHVIGSGKAVYDKAIIEPESMIGIYYRESFAYCIPYLSDYAQLEPGYFKERCEQAREFIDVLKTGKTAQALQPELQTIEDIVAKLDAEQFADLPEPRAVQEIMNTMLHRVESEIVGTLAELRPLAEILRHNQWAVPNMVSDAKDTL